MDEEQQRENTAAVTPIELGPITPPRMDTPSPPIARVPLPPTRLWEPPQPPSVVAPEQGPRDAVQEGTEDAGPVHDEMRREDPNGQDNDEIQPAPREAPLSPPYRPPQLSAAAAALANAVTPGRIDERFRGSRYGPESQLLQSPLGASHRRTTTESELARHVEDLEQERFALQQGLESSHRVAEQLAQELDALNAAQNDRAGALEGAERAAAEATTRAQAAEEALAAAIADRDVANSAASEASQRSEGLAAEVVHLEEELLRLRSREIKAATETEDIQREAEQRGRRLASTERELQEMRAAIEALAEEKRSLIVKLRRAANAASATNGDHSSSRQPRPRGRQDPADTAPQRAQEEDAPTTGDSVPSDACLHMLGSINTSIDALLRERRQLAAAAREHAAAAEEATAERNALRARLDVQTQQLELVVSRQAAAAGAGRTVANGQVAVPVEEVGMGDSEYFVDRALSLLVSIFVGTPSSTRPVSQL